MTKEAALYQFWASFGIPAFEENSVPSGASAPEYPYITYQVVIGEKVTMSASVWDRSTSWVSVNRLAESVGDKISRGGKILPCDAGAIWITRGTPFAQNLSDLKDEMIKRKVLNISAEYITED